ncbi:MAG: Ig-like domain-containing protein [Bacteroidia bacterium]|nr:Ig-like domain-containing protein [Bacteroidia bacterium]
MKPLRLKLSLLMLIMAFGAATYGQNETFSPGAYIIDMGAGTPTVNNSLKPYGLVYQLIVTHSIPVRWVINPAKVKDGTDVTVNSKNYRGGPFVIPASYITPAVLATINTWKSKGVIVDGPINVSFTAPVHKRLTSWPRAVLDDKNDGIVAAYYGRAEVPTTSYVLNGNPTMLTGCDDIYVLPHADPRNWVASWKTALNDYVTNGGWLWAACRAVSALEANTPTYLGYRFLSTNGLTPWGSHSDGSPATYVYNPAYNSDPVMQFIGTLNAATTNGSEQIYIPYKNVSSWRPTTRVAIYQPTHTNANPNEASVLVYGPAYGNPNSGWVAYLAGHDHDGTAAANIAAMRSYFNFILEAGIKKQPQLTVSIPNTVVSGSSISLSVNPTTGNPPYTYLWSSSCTGGSFSSPTSATTTYNAPTVTSNTECTISVRVTDNCGRVTYSSEIVIVRPPIGPTANPDNASTAFNTPVTINVLTNDTPGDTPLVPSTVTLVPGSIPPASQGVFSVNNVTGQITFTPAPLFSGTSTVQYQVCDQNNLCSTTLVTVTVGAPGGPTAVNDNASTPYLTPVNITVLANDIAGSTPLVPSSVTLVAGTTPPASQGVFTVNNTTGVVTFTPAVGFSGTSTVQYQVCDQVNLCATALVTVIVGPPTGPTANNDNATTPYNTPVTLNPLANDVAGSHPLVPSTVTLVAGTTPPASQGVFSVNNVTGQITFTPAVGFFGTSTVQYQVCDQINLCTQATVTVLVQNPAGPTANNDNATTPYNTPVTINVLANDTPGDSPLVPSTVSLVAGTTPPASEGVFSVNNVTGQVTFTPAVGFSGTSTVQYQVCDQLGFCDDATITVVVGPPTGPTANNDNASTPYNTPVTVNVLANDTPGSSPLVPSSVTLVPGTIPPASTGVFTVNNVTGQITFTPAVGFSGPATVSYQVCDQLNLCAQAVVTVTVGSPSGPTAVDDNATTPYNTPVQITVLANDIPGNSPLVPSSVTLVAGTTPPASQGVFIVNNTTGVITFVPAAGFSGVSTVQYQVCDQINLCDIALVTVTVGAPSGPTAVDDNATTPYNTPVTINVLSNDTPGNTPLVPSSVTLVAGTTPPASQGVFTVNGTTGQITFTPAAGFSGVSTVQYQVCDELNLCDIALVTVTVGPPAGPTANPDNASTPYNTPVTIDVLANDTPGSTPLVPGSVTLVPGTTPPASQGVFTVNPVTGQITFTPAPGFSGPATVQYQVCDQNNLCSTALVTVTVGSATGPTAVDDNATTPYNTPVTVNVLANDVAGSTPIVPSSVTLVTGTTPPASQGVFSVNNVTGQITFTPASGFSGTTTVEYQVCDQNNLCDQALVTVVVGAPAGPTANNDTGTSLQGNPVTIDVLANDTPGSTPLDPTTVTLVPGTLPNPATEGTFTVNPVTGVVTFTPVPTFSGVVTVQYQVCDQNNLCSIATITVTVIEGTSNLFPATGPGTLAYEDLWPAKGDYDFNDMVIDYQFEIIANTSNKVEQLIGTFTIKAFGASYENGFGFQLQSNISPTSITSVTGHQLTDNVVTLLSNGTEAGQSKPTFILFDNAFAHMPHPGMGIGVNTTPGAPYVTPVTMVMTINFEPNVVGINDLNIGNFNPFIIVNKVRSHEVHLPYYPPTDLANMSLFGQDDDNSNPSTNRWYVTSNNLPWAINIYESFDYPIEKQDIIGAHLKFAAWAMSGGIQFPDWYKNLPGYRNSSLIYQIP